LLIERTQVLLVTPTSKRKERSEKHRESKEKERERGRKKKFDIVHHENGRVLQKLQLNLTGCT